MNYVKDITKFIENKQVFCGIDIHKHRWNLCYICNSEVLESINIEGKFDLLLRHTQRKYQGASDIHFVYEAGFSGFYLSRLLQSYGYHCTITPPNRIPQQANKVKTDKRDAKKLAKYLAAGLLKTVFEPPISVESDRQLLRLRNNYQKKLTRVKNQIKSHLNLYGLHWSKDNGYKWTNRYINWLESLEFENENLRYILDAYLEDLHYLRGKIAGITRKLRVLSTTASYQKYFKILVACKGIGLITAMTFLLELSNILRFLSSKKLCSYIGLTPSQFSTGEHVRFGHITREGNSHVRRVLVEAAWTVIRHDPFLREKYDRICSRGSKPKIAIVAVARSLAVRLRRCLLDEKPYVIGVC